jgi:hypothetical protein
MIASTLPLSPSLPVAINPADFNPDVHLAKPPCLSAAAPRHPPMTQSRADVLLAHPQRSQLHMTLCRFLQRQPFVFIHLQILFAKTGGG